MAKKTIKKNLGASEGKPSEFKCMAEDAGEEDVILLFKNAPDKNKFDVVKLDRNSLPALSGDKSVSWIANFGIKEKSSEKYADMEYTVILSPRSGATLVCFDGEANAYVPVTVYTAPSEYPGKIAFDLTIGDPGAGWVNT